MMHVLVGSAPPHLLHPGRLLFSVVLHALTIAAAVEASRASIAAPRTVIPDTMLLVLPRAAPPEVRPAAPPPAPPVVVPVAEPPPQGFQTVVAPEDIPTALPPIDLNERPFDPRDYSGRGVEGGVADGVVGGTGKVERAGPLLAGTIYTAATDDARFQPALLVLQPEPKYPLVLQEIGLSGRVSLRFVIDTTGKVVTGSIEVVETSHQEFTAPARESIARAVFRAARVDDRPVRQLAQQAIRVVVPE
jgi:hypothetical protein